MITLFDSGIGVRGRAHGSCAKQSRRGKIHHGRDPLYGPGDSWSSLFLRGHHTMSVAGPNTNCNDVRCNFVLKHGSNKFLCQATRGAEIRQVSRQGYARLARIHRALPSSPSAETLSPRADRSAPNGIGVCPTFPPNQVCCTQIFPSFTALLYGRYTSKPWYKPRRRGLGFLLDRFQVFIGMHDDVPRLEYKCEGYRIHEVVRIFFQLLFGLLMRSSSCLRDLFDSSKVGV
jgi:hypothetical protein